MPRPAPVLPASTPAFPHSAGLARAAALTLASILFAVLLITFEPFNVPLPDEAERAPSGSNPVNQIGFSLLGMISAGGMLVLANRQRLIAALDPLWLLVIFCLLLSAMNAADPSAALRGVGFSFAVLLPALGVVALPWSDRDFRHASSAAIIVVILLSYAGLVLFPAAALHPPGGFEPQHEGLWRGVFSHKNIAGPAFAAFLYFGIYILRSGQRMAGSVILVLSALFMLGTGSRTATGLVLVAFAIVMAGRIFDSQRLPVALLIFALAGATMFTLGTVFLPTLGGFIAPIVGDASFTGRTTLWAQGLEGIAARPWTGYGFDSFWLTPVVTDSVVPFDIEWDYRGIVNGHNNYIDMALFMGLPGLALMLWLLCWRPLANYLHSPAQAANRRLADLGLMILAFVLMNSLLESTWLRRADPSWVMTIIAVACLRLARKSPCQQEET